MSYIDPDALLGALNDLNTAVADNTPALTTNGLTPATIQAKLKSMGDDLSVKRSVRDKIKTDLANAQDDFVQSAGDNYSDFSDLIDTVAGALGKKTPEGDRVLGYRRHLNASTSHNSAPAPAPAAATH